MRRGTDHIEQQRLSLGNRVQSDVRARHQQHRGDSVAILLAYRRNTNGSKSGRAGSRDEQSAEQRGVTKMFAGNTDEFGREMLMRVIQ